MPRRRRSAGLPRDQRDDRFIEYINELAHERRLTAERGRLDYDVGPAPALPSNWDWIAALDKAPPGSLFVFADTLDDVTITALPAHLLESATHEIRHEPTQEVLEVRVIASHETEGPLCQFVASDEAVARFFNALAGVDVHPVNAPNLHNHLATFYGRQAPPIARRRNTAHFCTHRFTRG